MTVTFYHLKSERIAVEKEIESVKAVNGYFRKETDIVNPELWLEDLPEETIEKIITANYVEIPEFKRFYFVNDYSVIATQTRWTDKDGVVHKSGQLLRFNLHCDVLSSAKEKLYLCDGYISRQQQSTQKYYNNGYYRTLSKPEIDRISFPDGFDTQNVTWVALCAPN